MNRYIYRSLHAGGIIEVNAETVIEANDKAAALIDTSAFAFVSGVEWLLSKVVLVKEDESYREEGVYL